MVIRMLNTRKRSASLYQGYLICLVLMLCLPIGKAATVGCPTLDFGFELYGTKWSNSNNGECSRHGTCARNSNNMSICICDEGWTGLSDIVNTDGIDCQISILGINIIWGSVMVFIIVAQVHDFPSLITRWRLYKNVCNEPSHYKKPKNRFKKRNIVFAALMSTMFTLLFRLALAAFGLLRIFKQEERIGVTLAATLLFGITMLLNQIALIFEGVANELLLQGRDVILSQRVDLKLLIVRYTFWSFNLFLVVFGFLPLIVYSKGGKINETTELIYKWHVGGRFGVLLFLSIVQLWAKAKYRSRVSEIQEVNPNSNYIQSNELQWRYMFVVLHTFILFAWLMIPFLWNRYDYYVPIYAYFVLFSNSLKKTVTVNNSGSRRKSKYHSKDTPNDINNEITTDMNVTNGITIPQTILKAPSL